MNDVARAAQVGLKTVSRVLNSEGGVRPALVARVETAVVELGYRHNAGASSLRRSDQSTATIGLILEDVANPFSSLLQRAVEDVARTAGFLVLAGSSDEDPVRERELIDTFCSRRVDGLLVVPAGDDHHYLARELASGMPLVLLDRPSAALPEADTVLCDNVEGAEVGTAHLIAHGHRRIGYLGDSLGIATARERLDGYLRALATAGVVAEPALIYAEMASIERASAATREMLMSERPPSAIFSSQNIVTIGAIKALRSLGLQHRVAVVGFDDFLLADMLDPPITVVAQDPLTIGRRGAELLFRRIALDDGPPERMIVRTRLLCRGSGEIRPS